MPFAQNHYADSQSSSLDHKSPADEDLHFTLELLDANDRHLGTANITQDPTKQRVYIVPILFKSRMAHYPQPAR